MTPYGRQTIDEEDIEAVVEVLRGDWLTQGPHIESFEEAVSDIAQANFAVAFSSGTAGLHAAAAVAGLGAGHTVVTSPLSFAASAACARYVGAMVMFGDIDAATLNLDPASVPDADALVAVHYAGLPMDLSSLKKRPRIVIEDAAHAFGALTPDGPVGNCAHSDMCMFSFHPVKTITSGEGGIVTTNDPAIADALRRFRTHGIIRKPESGEWYYEIEELGFNYRITDLQAALGVSQSSKTEHFITRRQALADRYRALLADLPLLLPPAAPAGWRHANHLFVIRIPDRARVYKALRAAGIGVQVHYVPIYRHPLYNDGRFGPDDFPETERAYEQLLSLPLYPGLTEQEQDHVVATLKDVL